MDIPRALRSTSSRRLRGLAGILGVLVVLEFVLRTWLASPLANEPDPDFGHFDRPYSSQIYSHEGYFRSTVNWLGLVDGDLWEPKPPVRALLLGDSFAEAKNVDPDCNFASIAEQAVDGLEVCNAGRSEFGPPSYAAFVELRAHLFVPDVLVVQLNDGDLREFFRPGRIRLKRRDGGYELVMRTPAPEPGAACRFWRLLKRSSALLTLSANRLQSLRRLETERLARQFSAGNARSSDASTGGGYPDDSVAMLEFLHRRMTQHYKDVVYLYIPGIRYDDSPQGRIRHPERRALYHEFADKVGAALVDPTDPMLAEFRTTRQPLHGFHNSHMGTGHLNARGHKIVGRCLADELKKRLP